MHAAAAHAAKEMEDQHVPEWKLSYRIDEACAATGYGLTKMWTLIREKKIRAKLDCGVTVILRDDLAAYLKSLPDWTPRNARD